MVDRCRGICSRYKVSPRYHEGHKNCRMCGVFIKWAGLRCPCCSGVLSTNPNCTRDRNRLKKARGVKAI